MILVILAILFTIIGFIGSILPALPGPIFCFAALLLLQFSKYHPFSRLSIIIRAGIIAAVSILDYIIPALGVKKFGGTKRGDRGSTIGLIVAVIVLPIFGITLGPFGLIGLIGGPFVGAYVGEKLYGKSHHHAMRAAFGSFIGFLAGTFLKIAISIIMSIIVFKEAYHIFF